MIVEFSREAVILICSRNAARYDSPNLQPQRGAYDSPGRSVAQPWCADHIRTPSPERARDRPVNGLASV